MLGTLDFLQQVVAEGHQSCPRSLLDRFDVGFRILGQNKECLASKWRRYGVVYSRDLGTTQALHPLRLFCTSCLNLGSVDT